MREQNAGVRSAPEPVRNLLGLLMNHSAWREYFAVAGQGADLVSPLVQDIAL
jgi:hypothetical protein